MENDHIKDMEKGSVFFFSKYKWYGQNMLIVIKKLNVLKNLEMKIFKKF